MIPFYILFIAAVYFAWICPHKSGKWVLFFLMLIMSMFRGIDVGGDDTAAYYNNEFGLDFSLESALSSNLEFLFVWWSNFIQTHHLNPRWCLYSLSIVQFLFLFLSSKRFDIGLEKVLFFFLLLNYYYLSLEISRQLAANAILLYGYSFLIEKRKKRLLFIPLVLLATSIHLSSIIALPFILCTYFKSPSLGGFDRLGYLVVAVAFIFMHTVGSKLANSIIDRIDLLRFYQHLVEETHATNSSIIGLFVQLIKFEFHYYVFVKITKSDHHLISNILLVSLVMSIFLSPITGNINRLVIIAGIIQIVAYPIILQLKYIPKQEKQLFIIAATVFWGVVCLRDVAAGNYFLAPYYITWPF